MVDTSTDTGRYRSFGRDKPSCMCNCGRGEAMTNLAVGRLVYGTYWKITDTEEAVPALLSALERDDGELEDLIDVLCEEQNASAVYMDGTYTLYYGHVVTDV